MGFFRLLGIMSPAHIMWFHWTTHGKYVGRDALGNKYYCGGRRVSERRERRWVLYKGAPEASSVPPEWHGWLHYQTDKVPSGERLYPWQKPHRPNLTGTTSAYRPKGHALKGGHRDQATGDYEPWHPND